MRSLTPVEAAIAFALGGSILAVAVPECARGLHASRLAEPVDGLKRIAAAAVSLASATGSDPTFPPSAPLTPPDVPRGVRAEDPPGVWEQPTWRALAFSFDHPHAFSFAFDGSGGPAVRAFAQRHTAISTATASISTFEVEGEADANGAHILPGMYVDREVE